MPVITQKLSQGQMKPINSINFAGSQTPRTNIVPVPPPLAPRFASNMRPMPREGLDGSGE